MEVPSLQDIAIGQIVDLLIANKLTIHPVRIGDELRSPPWTISNQIFQTLRDKTNLNPKLLDEMNKLDITDVIYRDSKPFDELDMKMCKVHDIQLFTMDRFEQEMFKTVYQVEDNEHKTNDDWPLDLHKLLSDTLKNPRTLRHLDIYDIRQNCLQQFLFEIDDSYHNLETLKVNENMIHMKTFERMESVLPNLETLHIGLYELSGLNGISKFKNLKNLLLSVCSGFPMNALDDLFGMENLQKLDFSFTIPHGLTNQMKMLLLENENSIPNLTYLNCANCIMTEQNLRDLVAKQPALREIVIVGTEAQEIDIPGVILYKDTTFQHCKASLIHLTQYKKADIVKSICETLEKMEDIDEKMKELEEMIHVLDDVTKVFKSNYQVLVAVMDCIWTFRRKKYLDNLSIPYKNMIVHLFIRDYPAIPDSIEEIPRGRWQFLKYDDLIKPLEINWLIPKAMNATDNYYGCFQETLMYDSMKFIQNSIENEKLNEENMRKMMQSNKFIRLLIDFVINDAMTGYGETAYYPSLFILNQFALQSKSFCERLVSDNGNFPKLMVILRKYSTRSLIQAETLLLLVKIACHLDIENEFTLFYEKENIDVILMHTLNRRTGNDLSIYASCTLLSVLLCSQVHRNQEEWISLNEKLKSTIKSIQIIDFMFEDGLQNMNFFQKIPLDSDMDGPIFWMLLTLKRGLRMMASWIPELGFDIRELMDKVIEAQSANEELIDLANEVKEMAN